MATHECYEVRWRNFKGFSDTGWIRMRPITLLIGTNNAGKTSFISPLLLMHQTLLARDTSAPLVMNGDILDAGKYSDIFRNHDLSQDLTLGFKYHQHERKTGEKLRHLGQYPPGSTSITFGVEKRKDSNFLFVKKESVYDVYDRHYFTLQRETPGPFTLESPYSHLDKREAAAIRFSNPANFLFTPNSVLSALRHKSREGDALMDFSQNFSGLLQAISWNFSQLSRILVDINYLGPIREYPKRYYEIGDEQYSNVGQRGEHLAEVLKQNFPRIRTQLNKWIRELGFGDSLRLTPVDREARIYSIEFRDTKGGVASNFTNVGFGASQILPLLVQALVAPKDGITIAEQPEIHLNPKLQSLLADIFVYMARHERRVIVESHSEHLLLRLRLLIARGEIARDDVGVYFVEKAKSGSKLREITISEAGQLKPTQWPSGFFAETLKHSLALAKEASANRVAK